MNILNLEKRVKIGDHSFIEIKPSEWLEIEPIPTNRDSQLRVNKMKKIFNDACLSGHRDTLSEVALGVVIEDFEDIDEDTNRVIRKYKKNEVFRVDGNTRAEWLKAYPEKINEFDVLTAKIHFLKSFNDIEYAYYPYNNQKSVENSFDILQGLAKRYQWKPRQLVFARGAYKTAIDYSTVSSGVSNVYESFYKNLEGLKFMDNIGIGKEYCITKPRQKKIKSQAIMGAILLAYRVWGNNKNLRDFVYKISNISYKDIYRSFGDIDSKIDGVTVVASEYMGLSHMRKLDPTETDKLMGWTEGAAGQSNFVTQHAQMDFLMYWIEKYIDKPEATYTPNRIKPIKWKGTFIRFLKDMEE